MNTQFTNKTVRQCIETVSDQYYPMTGSVIAMMAAQAAALAEACIQISLDNQVDKLDWQDVTTRIGQMAHLKDTLLEWSNQDISAGTDDSSVPAEVNNQLRMFDYATEIAKLAVQAAKILQDFRPMAYINIENDLDIASHLLTSTAQTASFLLEHHLQSTQDAALVEKYQPILAALKQQIDQLITARPARQPI